MISNLCIRCKGKGLCGHPCSILARFKEKAPKVKEHFSGNSPPEIFVGRVGYPHVYSGILSPPSSTYEDKETSILSTPEQWVKNNIPIDKILEMRSQLIYGRKKTQIKTTSRDKLRQLTQELALSSKPVSTEVFLKKKPYLNFTASKFHQIITNPAPIKSAKLEENPKVNKKIDYLTNDKDVLAENALTELNKAKISTTHLQKLLAAGLLGRKKNRKLVPTRWAITAVDDTLGKELLEKIRYYPESGEIQLFHYDYNGNHFECLLLPARLSFEVIEVSISGSTWTEQIKASKDVYMQDYEGFYSRKQYAKQVVGAYYADRLAVCEYLNKIKKQATCLLLHEERPEYYAPLGVGIIRESLRNMFKSNPDKPANLKQALSIISSRVKANMNKYKRLSWTLANYGKQKSLKEFI
ncbi:MAG: Nre family DNA repair protein [Candidatus Nanoarchaeia archaeon]